MPGCFNLTRLAGLLPTALLSAALLRAETRPLEPSLTPRAGSAGGALSVPLAFPGQTDVYLRGRGGDWVDGVSLQGSLVWPAGAPRGAQLLAFMKDRDGNWYQSLREAPLTPGTNAWAFPFGADAPAWQPVGHHAAWHLRARIEPQFVGVRIFAGHGVFTGACEVAAATLTLSRIPPAGPPQIRNVRPNAGSVPCYGLFELRLDLPDRYADPFDPAVIDLGAVIETPDGRTNTLNGFYLQDFFRVQDAVGERLVPQGRPEWRVRYTPTVPGVHRYTLSAVDRGGAAVWGPATFEARPADGPGFVRVSRRAPRHFELDGDRPFFPIGHNIRSPFDTRMDEQFPWRFRYPEGSLAYARYFRDMHAAGENLAEVWMCAWSLGLEWSDVKPGYHGAGDYHLGNAWELDEVLREARANELRINLVLNNHGRASSWCDEEWADNPYSVERGGPVRNAFGFFDHPDALALQRKLLRYTVARWGWDSSIFAWELWSELNLTGDDTSKARAHFDPRVVAWHRTMGDYLRLIDPNRHLITTHLSSDYSITNPELAALPQFDHCAIDAYHNSPAPLRIVQLLSETASYYTPFGKPVIVTEFGGSPMAAGVNHLRCELHAALWTSTSSLIAGTPLFWWWQVIEENGFYEMYRPVARFMADVDRRDPRLAPTQLALAFEDGPAVPPYQVDNVCLASPDLVLAWIFIRPCFTVDGKELEKPIETLSACWQGCPEGTYRVEFWDTREGRPLRRVELRAEGGRLVAKVPPLRRDVALKIRRLP